MRFSTTSVIAWTKTALTTQFWPFLRSRTFRFRASRPTPPTLGRKCSPAGFSLTNGSQRMNRDR